MNMYAFSRIYRCVSVAQTGTLPYCSAACCLRPLCLWFSDGLHVCRSLASSTESKRLQYNSVHWSVRFVCSFSSCFRFGGKCAVALVFDAVVVDVCLLYDFRLYIISSTSAASIRFNVLLLASTTEWVTAIVHRHYVCMQQCKIKYELLPLPTVYVCVRERV